MTRDLTVCTRCNKGVLTDKIRHAVVEIEATGNDGSVTAITIRLQVCAPCHERLITLDPNETGANGFLPLIRV